MFAHPVDISGTVVGESPECLLLSSTVVGENPGHVCWAMIIYNVNNVDEALSSPCYIEYLQHRWQAC